MQYLNFMVTEPLCYFFGRLNIEPMISGQLFFCLHIIAPDGGLSLPV
jgi:hypothetical protein